MTTHLPLDLVQRQNLTTGSASLTFPNLSFRQSERFPLRRAATTRSRPSRSSGTRDAMTCWKTVASRKRFATPSASSI